jgi:DNA polymerase
MPRRAAYLAALGVPDWRQRRPFAVVPAVAPVAMPVALSAASPPESRHAEGSGSDTWDKLAAEVAACTRCGLHECRNRTVFGVGDHNARWLLVGEAPGAEEDRQGEPFVGRAGKLLDAMLHAIGLVRGQVFIANVLKCRPPDNRVPAPAEVAQCLPYLERQIALLRPSIMLALGSVAAQNLLATDQPVGRLRGHVHAFGSARTPLIVTYHPAYLLRSPGEKRKAWEDLKFARRTAGGKAD